MSHCPTHVFSPLDNQPTGLVQCSMFNVQIEHLSRRLMTLNHPLPQVVPTALSDPQRKNSPRSTRRARTISRVSCLSWVKNKKNHGRHGTCVGSPQMHEPLLTCGLLTQSTIYSVFKEHREYTDPRIEHKHIDKRQEAALSRYGRVGVIVSIVSILPVCRDMVGLAGVLSRLI